MPSAAEEPAAINASVGIATEPRYPPRFGDESQVEVLGMVDIADEPWSHQTPTTAIAAPQARQLQE